MGGKRTGKMFRFQDMEIWKKAIEIADKLFDIAEDLDTERLYRFAEQIRGAGLSMFNNRFLDIEKAFCFC